MGENKNLIYILAGTIGVLLVAAGFILYRNFTRVPDVSDTAGAGVSSQTGGGQPAADTGVGSTAFDAKTATKLSGATPKDHVKAYHDAVVAKKWDAAFKLLPLAGAGQQKYGDAAAFGKQLEGYGITGFDLGEAKTDGDVTTVDAKLVMPMMPQGLTYTWTFKKVGGAWYCVDRKSAM